LSNKSNLGFVPGPQFSHFLVEQGGFFVKSKISQAALISGEYKKEGPEIAGL
jgi:hypothetical protein